MHSNSSPLPAASGSDESNPLLQFTGLPRFDAIRAEHIKPAIEQVLHENRLLVAALTADPGNRQEPDWNSLIQPLDEAEDRLDKVWSTASHLNGVMNTPAIRAAYEDCQSLVTEYYAELGQNVALFECFASLHARAGLLGREWPAGDVGPLVDLIDEPGHEVTPEGTYRLSEAQAKAILELRLQRLTGLERGKIAEELETLAGRIRGYLTILGSRERLMELLRAELIETKERFNTPRRTAIEDSEFEHDIEDLIPREDMVVTVSHGGYIKRVPLSTYRSQRRGGRGRAGMAMREEDFVSSLFVCDTHTPVLFFSSRGMVYKLKVWRLPLGTPQARGKALVNILPLQEGETITAWMALPEDENTWGEMDVMFATSAGTGRRGRLFRAQPVHHAGVFAGRRTRSRNVLINLCVLSFCAHSGDE